MKQLYRELGLVDPEMAKTSFTTNWIVKAMEQGDSDLQLMLRYRLSRYSPKKT